MKQVFYLIIVFSLSVVIIHVVLNTVVKMSKKQPYRKLRSIDFAQLDKLIESKESFIVYFGWTSRCPDSLTIQSNYLDKRIGETVISEMKLVDLDILLPKALTNKELRTEMKNKYGVYYGPTFVKYIEGKIVDMLEHNEETNDSVTAIKSDLLDEFFKTK